MTPSDIQAHGGQQSGQVETSCVNGPAFEARLRTLNPKIQELMRIAGTAGLSLGVFRKDEPVFYANFGYRDIDEKLPVSEKTIFPACSQTKLFVAMAMALAVDDPANNLTWDTRVKNILPDFNVKDDILRESMTITDILAHRSGMSAGHFRLGSENNMIVALSDSMKFINNQIAVHPFRQQFHYNNLGYQLAGLILDKVSHSWGDVLRERLFRPLNMKRTFTCRPPEGTDNVSKAYNTLDDAMPVEVPTVKSGEGSFGGASGGMFSCVEDLLGAYANTMHALKDQFQTDLNNTERSPIRRAQDIFSAKMLMTQPTYGEASYGLGVCRVQLPGPMGHIGVNPGLMPDGKMPIVGKGAPSRLVFYHQGSLPGALSAVAMIPDLDTAVVVMSNSLALNDCADWVIQLVLEEILLAPVRNDYIELAKTTVESNLRWYPSTVSALEKERKQHGLAPSRSLGDYVGTYWNKQRYAKIEVTLSGSTLSWALQGWESEKYDLDHYVGDTFLWLKPRNYLVSRGRWVDQTPSFWKLKFRANDSSDIFCVDFVHESEMIAGEDFFKDNM